MMKSVLFVALLVALASQSYAIPGEDTVVPETTIREDPLEKNPSSSARLEDRLGSQVTNVDPPVTLLLEDALEGASEETTEVQERFLRLRLRVKKVGKRINEDMKKLGKDVKKFGKAASKKTQKVVKKVLKHVKKTEKKVTDFFNKPWFKRFKWTDQALETTEVQESANNGQQEGFFFKAVSKAWRSVSRSVKKEVKKVTKIVAGAIPAATGVMGLRHAGKDCWSGCKHKQGRCSWCGPTGFCCRKGWHSHGCNGMGGMHNHVCTNHVFEKVKKDLNKINNDMKKAKHDVSKFVHHHARHLDTGGRWH